jgi:ATP diphosphatase
VSGAAPTPIERLLEVMARLRDPEGGCPWDLEQDFASIAPYTIEEAYEVADAIARGDLVQLKDELGDLLLQVAYHAQMAKKAGLFDFDQVAAAIADKMIRRHPHVFGGAEVESARAQSHAWEGVKATERASRAGGVDGKPGVLDDVPLALPALVRAAKLQRRAARVGFDWPQPVHVLDKIDEEIAELRAELEQGASCERLSDEIGDLLFAVVNLARHLEVDGESALRRANAKFERRFRRVEDALSVRGRRLEDASLEEMEALWQQAKATEREQT